MFKSNKLGLLVLILLNYFTFMMISSIIGVLLVNWQTDFHLKSSTVVWLGSMFFLAYGLTSLPQGILLEKWGSKKTLLYATSIIFLGALLFAIFPSFYVGLMSLFVIGTGVTALQIVGNLLVKRLDEDPEKYSRNLTLSQVFCGLGAMSGAFLNSYLSVHFTNFQWTTYYYVFAVLMLIMMVLTVSIELPTAPRNNTVRPTTADYLKLIGNPLMLMFAFGIFIYVGIEVGIANWIKAFFQDRFTNNFENSQLLLAYGDKIVGSYWLFQSIGRFTSGFVLNYLKTTKALVLYAIGAIIALYIATSTSDAQIAGYSFIAIGFFTSLMFPSIFSMAVNQFSDREDIVAGILCTAILGGALVQLLIGKIADYTSLTNSLLIIGSICFGYIASLGLMQMNKKNN